MTNLANHLEQVSHDQINRYLKNIDLGAEILWKNVKEEIVNTEDSYLIFYHRVINKKYSQKIELVRRQYSGNEHGVSFQLSVISYQLSVISY
ncbi:MAG: hypothetical protein F6K17_17405 [Okeania sp. SIO3C4]|nr:hypothetical protein [Okeania sp. SIO3C4]